MHFLALQPCVSELLPSLCSPVSCLASGLPNALISYVVLPRLILVLEFALFLMIIHTCAISSLRGLRLSILCCADGFLQRLNFAFQLSNTLFVVSKFANPTESSGVDMEYPHSALFVWGIGPIRLSS
jgi:hypothetical protein